MTDKDLERRKTRHATLAPYANIASPVNLKSGAFTYHPPCNSGIIIALHTALLEGGGQECAEAE